MSDYTPDFKIKAFTEYIELYKNNEMLTKNEYFHFLKASRNDYLKFTGLNTQVKKYNRYNRITKDPNAYNYYTTPVFYENIDLLNQPVYNTICQNPDMCNETIKYMENFSVTYKTDAPLIPKTQIHLTVINKSIGGLIDVINENPYSPLYEYNIDLKLLNNIKFELEELNNMIGMKSLKETIYYQIMYFAQSLHIGSESDYKHTVIYGPPGTGKTEIAKIIGRLYAKMGILKKGTFKKVSRNDLIAGYLGQTAIKTKQVIDDCLGGCLFIDEAYSLSSTDKTQDIFSKECIDILCEALSEHRDELMVIIAGYEDEIKNCFFNANEGLESRFIWRFKIDKYTANELMRIFIKKTSKNDWVIDCDETKLETWFSNNINEFKYYGRDMELLFTFVKMAHSSRIYGLSPHHKKKIVLEDIICGFDMFKTQKTDNNSNKYMDDYIKNTMYS